MDGVKHRFKEICLKCPFCGQVFRISRGFKDRLKQRNFDCKECNFVNKSFSIKKYSDTINYQSKKELEFIELCVSKNILLTNGDKIPYVFNGTVHMYRIDFKLPDLKLLIEIKDMHVWHKQQLKSGKWAAKEKVAIKYCEQNGYKYKILFPWDFDIFFKAIERDSLNCNESYRG